MSSHGHRSHGLRQRIAPDWSQLLPEILEAISMKIRTMGDYFRYRAVCTSWRSASPPLPRHLPPQMPWLMSPFLPVPDSGDARRLFVDTLDGEVHRLDLPETLCVGVTRGWLVLERDQEIFLFNPITRSQVSLPPLSTCLHGLSFQEGAGVDHKGPVIGTPYRFLEHRPAGRTVKAIASSDPSTSDCTVMAFLITPTATSLAFCRVGDGSWTIIWHPYSYSYYITDITYCDGSFYAVTDEGRLAVYKVGPPWSAQLIPSTVQCGGVKCLVERPAGELLMVNRPTTEPCQNLDVFKLDVLHGEPGWVQVKDIGESMLFLGGWNRRHCISCEFSGRGGNCIYFVDRFYGYSSNQIGYFVDRFYGYSSNHIVLFDIKDGRVKHTADSLGTSPTGELFPAWIWFQPNLR